MIFKCPFLFGIEAHHFLMFPLACGGPEHLGQSFPDVVCTVVLMALGGTDTRV